MCPRRIESTREIILESAIIWGICYKYRKSKTSAYEHRDCAEIFSVRHGTYPGEKSLPSHGNCRVRMTES